MKRIAFTLSLVSVAALIAYTSVAQPPGGGRGGQGGGGRPGGPGGFGPPPSPVVEAIDKDRNHQLSAKEIENAAAALRTLDRNNDGRLSEDELRPRFGPPGGPDGRRRGPDGGGGRPAGPPPEGDRDRRGERGGGERGGGERGGGERGGDANVDEVVARIMNFDKNEDGKVSKDELPERMQSIVTRGDTNKDGAISREELTKVAAAFDFGGGRGGEGGPGPGRPGGEGGRGPGGPGGFGGPPSPEMFVEHALRFDADKDGKLSKDELHQLAQEFGRRRGGEGGGGRPRDGGRREGSGTREARPARPASE